MSMWTYVNGTIKVDVPGRTQPECQYIIETVLSHLPRVTGSEEDMQMYILKENGWNTSCNVDEFGQHSNLYEDRYRMFEMQSEYIITINGSLRDREFDQTLREFNKWICRLAKRLHITGVVVDITNMFDKEYIIKDGYGRDYGKYSEMYEYGKDNWTDYLMWDYAQDEEEYILEGKPKK